MNNNMMMLLPLLMNMGNDKSAGNGQMTEMLLNMMKQQDSFSGGGIDPMTVLLLSMMNKPRPEKTSDKADFGAISGFSGNEVLEIMKALTRAKGS